MDKYIERLTDKIIKENLEVFGAVCVEGPKWCGKTTSCKQLAKTVIEFHDPIKKELYKNIITIDATELLKGDNPILFDEWQENPEIWDILRHDIDKKSGTGLYILTGSNSIDRNKIMHSGTGRFTKIKMRPMSLYERGSSTGKISLNDLFYKNNTKISGESTIGVRELASLIVKGGFPATIDRSEAECIKIMNGYYDSLVNEDIINIDGIKREPSKMNAILKSYSRNISTTVSDATIKRDIENEEIILDNKTFLDYKNTLERLYIIENVPAWSPKLRSKTAIRTSDKKEIVDTGIVCAALGLTSDIIVNDLNYFGFLFESLCMNNLRIYAESIDGSIYHYREEKGFEIDTIIKLRDDKWGAIEIKLGANEIDKAAKNLLKLKERVITRKEPSFLMILYGGKYAYKREDGVLVIPITCLKN